MHRFALMHQEWLFRKSVYFFRSCRRIFRFSHRSQNYLPLRDVKLCLTYNLIQEDRDPLVGWDG